VHGVREVLADIGADCERAVLSSPARNKDTDTRARVAAIGVFQRTFPPIYTRRLRSKASTTPRRHSGPRTHDLALQETRVPKLDHSVRPMESSIAHMFRT
jgi:hypothetical protein